MLHCDMEEKAAFPKNGNSLITWISRGDLDSPGCEADRRDRAVKCEYSRINLDELDRYFAPCS
jgi:hypothetical protein